MYQSVTIKNRNRILTMFMLLPDSAQINLGGAADWIEIVG